MAHSHHPLFADDELGVDAEGRRTERLPTRGIVQSSYTALKGASAALRLPPLPREAPMHAHSDPRPAGRRRFVFLDYDGVASCLEETAYADQPFGKRAVRNINALCRAWGAQLVLTSSWRWNSCLPGDEKVPFREAAARFLASNGIDDLLVPEEACAVPEYWRSGEKGMDAALRVRARHGVVLAPRLQDDGRPREDRPRRGDEVRAWLDVIAPDAADEDWLLLDDEDDYWPTQTARLVLTNDDQGFDDEALARALALVGAAVPQIEHSNSPE